MFLPLELSLRPSRIYSAVMALAHGLALLGIWLAALPVGAQAMLTLALSVSVIWAWREISSGPRGLRVSQSGQMELQDGEWRAAQIKGRPVVLPWLISLTLVSEAGKTCRLMFWPDCADADLLRKLRVWLRWGPQQTH
jgi:hypothetical protein